MITPLRLKAARAALRAHHERKNAKRHRLTDAARMDPAQNPDLRDDFADLIADTLQAAVSVGLDPLEILSGAISHVRELGAAHYAVGRVIADRDEKAA